MPKIIAITSGKGGVGKTNISVNLAVRLARLNHKVCLFDADLGLANINILLGLTPEHTLEDVFSGKKRLRDIIIRDINAIDIIPGSSGIEIMAEPSHTEIDEFVRPLSDIDNYDFIFFDTSAGISRHVIAFCMAAGSLILTIIPEPTSFTDSYALIKVLHQNGFKGRIDVVINRCKTTNTARKIFLKFHETVSKYLKVDLNYLGAVVEDPQVSEAVTGQRPFIEMFPGSVSSSCIRDIASQFTDNMQDIGVDTIESFWTSFTRLLKPPSSEKTTMHKKEPTPQKVNDGGYQSPVFDISEKVVTALNALVENTAAITFELGALRKAIEKSDKGNVVVDPVEKKIDKNVSPTIQLDFEKFLIKRKT